MTTAATAPREVARGAAAALGAADRLTVIAGRAAAGRLDRQAVGGEARASRRRQQSSPPEYLLLTDADIVHAPDALRWLVAQARGGELVLDLADGEAALRELCRARAHSGLHLFLPDALSRSPG